MGNRRVPCHKLQSTHCIVDGFRWSRRRQDVEYWRFSNGGWSPESVSIGRRFNAVCTCRKMADGEFQFDQPFYSVSRQRRRSSRLSGNFFFFFFAFADFLILNLLSNFEMNIITIMYDAFNLFKLERLIINLLSNSIILTRLI